MLQLTQLSFKHASGEKVINSVSSSVTEIEAFSNEPPHDTKKVTVRPVKTQISLGISPVWSVFAVHSMGN